MKGEGGVHFYDRRVVGYNFMLQTRHWNAAQVAVNVDDGIVARDSLAAGDNANVHVDTD